MNKMYVIVRKDLGNIYKMVQGSHALAQFMLEHGQIAKEWNNSTIVFGQVESEEQLFHLIDKLEIRGIEYSKFNEPDIDNQLTAIASYTEEKIFRNIKLACE